VVGVDEPRSDQVRLPGVLHALSDPTRLAVLAQLAGAGELSCGDLDVSVAKSTLSQHLRVLRRAGVTRTRPDGNQRWLSLRRAELDELFPGLIGAVLDALAASGAEPAGRPPDRAAANA